MSNTYSKIYLHIIFAVKHRESLMPPAEQPRLHQYFASMLQKAGHFPIAIGGTDNHVHILIDYKPSQSIPDMVKDLKVASAKFINSHRLIPFSFAWQRGYGCVSYSPSQIDAVRQYIINQKQHHEKMTLREEMTTIYDRFGIDYDPRFIFEEC